MKVYCKGFNLYGQLNHSDTILSKFLPTIEENQLESIIQGHSFAIITHNKCIKVLSNLLPKSIEQTIARVGKINKIACNNNLVLILTDENKVFKIAIDSPQKMEQLPKFTDENDKVTNVEVGETMFIAYTESGKLYSIPEQLEFKNKEILDIKVGREHCLLLKENGEVYSFGRGSRGQLGHGCLEDESSPKLIEALTGLKIVQIAAGGWHSMALSADGDIYSWGWNGNGQLGHSTSKNVESTVQVMATPTLVELDQNVTKIACGARHSLVLFENSTIYGCGWNKYKQLIEQAEENVHCFIFLHDFSKENVSELICGPWNSAIICR